MLNQYVEPASALEAALLDEARHRHANELAAVLASLHLLKAKLPSCPDLLAEAIARVDSGARLERLLLDPGTDDLSAALEKLRQLLSASRVSSPRYDLRSSVRLIIADPAHMRLCLLIAYEMLSNAEKHSHGFDPVIRVRLRMTVTAFILTVSNDGVVNAGAALRRMSGLSIVWRLIHSVGGRLNMRRQAQRVCLRAIFPLEQHG